MTKVLVAYATVNGAAEALAHAIGQQLQKAGFVTDTLPADDVITLKGYHSVILGSDIWHDDWLPGATEFLDSFQDALREKNVWLFSSDADGSLYLPYPVTLETLVNYVRPLDTAVFLVKGAPEAMRRWTKVITAHLDTVLRVRA
jgi:flavodoxin